jgi:UDP-glucose:(heptosyl)LPS alpha-1,3-glucosyltransferase
VKLALVHPKFDTLGGAEYYALRLAEGLIARGHEVHLYARRVASFPRGGTLHRVLAVPLGRAIKAWTFCWSACRRLERERFDIVQGLGRTTCQTVHRTGGGVHRAYLEQSGSPRRTLYDRVATGIEDELFASKRLRAVICASRLIAQQVERFYPAAGPKVRIIPNGVDTASFEPEGRDSDRAGLRERLGLPRDASVLLFMGTNFQRKGLDLAVDALAHLPEAHLVVGGGDSPGPFAAQAAASGVGDRVHFIGFQEDRPPVYRAADIFVLPTRYDAFANVCLESLACGTPVVTSDHNGVATILCGSTAGEESPLSAGGAGIAASVKSLLERGSALREEARGLALRYDQERHVAAVESLYQEIVAGA